MVNGIGNKKMKISKFVGRKNAYALQIDNGSYICVNKPITEALLTKHIAGEATIGSYLINELGLIEFGVIDIDCGKDTITNPLEHPVYSFAEVVYGLFPDFTRCLEFSGRRGFHIWLWTKTPEQPRFIRELIKSRLKKVDVYNIEIYPKQDKLDGKGYGNQVKLPLGIHKKSGLRSFIIKEDIRSSEKEDIKR